MSHCRSFLWSAELLHFPAFDTIHYHLYEEKEYYLNPLQFDTWPIFRRKFKYVTMIHANTIPNSNVMTQVFILYLLIFWRITSHYRCAYHSRYRNSSLICTDSLPATHYRQFDSHSLLCRIFCNPHEAWLQFSAKPNIRELNKGRRTFDYSTRVYSPKMFCFHLNYALISNRQRLPATRTN